MIGVYLEGAPLSPYSQEVRGNENSFLFRLDGPKGAVQFNPVKHNIDTNNEISQYAVCTRDSMRFGGSIANMSNAIRINDDLKTCFSGV